MKLEWVVVITLSTLTVFIVPLVCFYWHRFLQHEEEEIALQKRFPRLVSCINLFTVFFLLQRPLVYIAQTSPLLSTNFETWRLLAHLNQITLSVIVTGLNCCVLGRVWLIYYELHYSFVMMNKQWTLHLDPSLIEKSFWLKYKSTLGSAKIVMCAVCSIHIAFSIAAMVYRNTTFSQCNQEDESECSRQTAAILKSPWIALFACIALLVAVVFTVYCVFLCRWPKLADCWYIRLEFKYIIVTTTTLVVLIAVVVIVAYMYRRNLWIAFVSQTGYITLVTLVYVSSAMIPTTVIVHKLHALPQNERKQRQPTGSRSKSANDDGPKLSAILTSERDFVLFVNHLCREFAVEVMLCFVEMLQFKYALNQRYPLQCQMKRKVTVAEQSDEIQTDYFDFVECDVSQNAVIPQSFIVHHQQYTPNSNNEKERWLRVVHALYRKYLQIGCELQVNISGELRRYFRQYMHSDDVERFVLDKQEMEEIELFELFDEVIEEMYHLMLTSRDRFMSTQPSITMTSLLSQHQNGVEEEDNDEKQQETENVWQELCAYNEPASNETATLRDVGRTETGEYSQHSVSDIAEAKG